MNLVTIGRFSKMTRLSVKALRLYDEIGLLVLADVDASSGYRYYVYHQVIDEETDGDIEICVPVGSALPDGDEVYTRELQGGTMATTMHRGPYQEIAPAYHTVIAWISDHGHEIAGPPREVYLNDPQTVPEKEHLTRVEFPVEDQTS